MNIPSVINNFNVYRGEASSRVVGTTGEITLPTIEAKTSTVQGAGILGEIEEGVIGQFGSIKMDIPFRVISSDVFSVMRTDEVASITIRGAVQGFDTETSKATMTQLKIVVKGKVTSVNPGTMKIAEQMNCSTSLELTYIKIEYDNKVGLELDKLNSVYIVDGADMLADIKDMI